MQIHNIVEMIHKNSLTLICDQICQKGSYTRTVSSHTFHRHLIATSTDQQHMCLILLKVEQFTSFSWLSDINECLIGWPSNGSILPCQADSQLWFTTRLADEFGHRFSCFVWHVEVKIAPMEVIWLFSKNIAFACHCVAHYLPPTHSKPYRSASGIGYTNKKPSKMVDNSASYI